MAAIPRFTRASSTRTKSRSAADMRKHAAGTVIAARSSTAWGLSITCIHTWLRKDCPPGSRRAGAHIRSLRCARRHPSRSPNTAAGTLLRRPRLHSTQAPQCEGPPVDGCLGTVPTHHMSLPYSTTRHCMNCCNPTRFTRPGAPRALRPAPAREVRPAGGSAAPSRRPERPGTSRSSTARPPPRPGRPQRR